jgi:hypothetical protein
MSIYKGSQFIAGTPDLSEYAKSSDVTSKANTNLSNVSSVSSSFKEQSVSWGLPDYSAGISISTNSYTAPSAGFIVLDGATTSGNGGGGTIKINSQVIDILSTNLPSGSTVRTAKQVFVAKGDVVELSTPATFYSKIFYPLKGVK